MIQGHFRGFKEVSGLRGVLEDLRDVSLEFQEITGELEGTLVFFSGGDRGVF